MIITNYKGDPTSILTSRLCTDTFAVTPAQTTRSAAAAGTSSHRGTLEAVAEARRAGKGRPGHTKGGGKR